jgi:hypothetical protein
MVNVPPAAPFEKNSTAGAAKKDSTWPYLVPLTRESVPVRRNNRTLSHKTSYSGVVSVGYPAQDFRVVFDTGSAHIVLPSSDCQNETCLVHRQYNISKSDTALAINADGEPVPPDELCDQLTIGYGTGKVKGEFVRDQVCLGGNGDVAETCVEMAVVMAVEMTTHPFKSFRFDGIFGLALDSLAVSQEFSFFDRLAASNPGASPRFGVFLTEVEDDGEEREAGSGLSEIALGGHNEQRLLSPLRWTPVANKHDGHWQVEIREVRVGNRTLDVCSDGTCRGVVDTGTSHLGVPSQYLNDFTKSLLLDGSSYSSCREVPGPTVELVLDGFTLTLTPDVYMPTLPLPPGFSVNSRRGVSVASSDAPAAVPASSSPLASAAARIGAFFGGTGGEAVSTASTKTCAPKVMPVNLPAPLGPKLFILGEPVLHRYYTVYDWKEGKIGFGLSATERNQRALKEHGEEGMYSFMQVTLTVTVRARRGSVRAPLALE